MEFMLAISGNRPRSSYKSRGLESCPPPPALSGYAAVNNIRNAVQHHGPIKAFRSYLDIFSPTGKAVPQHQLQTSGMLLNFQVTHPNFYYVYQSIIYIYIGVTLTYVARSARESLDQVMLGAR